MDDFKTLNDTLGHASGDLLLKQVARRLTGCIRESDTVARLGGDEFVVMLENLSDNERLACGQAETVAKKVLASIGKSYSLDGHEHHCTASIGVTLFGAENEDIEEPLKRADLAMYQAKTAGRNTLRFFDPEMQSRLMARAAMEADLRAGLQNQHFILYFQPQITNQHHISGAEALLRWSHPVRGMELPANFIALAEETGLILPLGQWVLQSACDQLAQWAGQAALAHLKIAVNVSARQFHQNDFVDQVLEIVKRTGAKPELLRLELTESVLISNVEAVIAKMNALKAFGIGFAIDDFGTGYSSLSYLKRLPLDELKIDQGFVKDILIDPDDAAIARMVIALGRSLELDILAEGVETEQQRAFLAELGCHNYQGYLFSRPVPAQEFEALVMQI
jgi:diguanylate cyclase (GGDEF)-like protein